MIHEKYMGRISIIAMLLAVVFMVSAIFIKPTSKLSNNNSTIKEVLNKEKVTDVKIEINSADWKWLLDNATKEEYRSGNITINGETFHNVGIRPKGNSSLSMVASDDKTDRFSLKIDFGQYVDGQTYHGIRALALNNIISDATYMKEYISYDVFSLLGVSTPEYTYTNISVNGKEWGLYLAVEVIDERFVEKEFGSLEGNLYKPDSMEMNGMGKAGDGVANGEKPPMGDIPKQAPNENAAEKNTGENKEKAEENIAENKEKLDQKQNQPGNIGFNKGGTGGSNLKYIDDKQSSYSTIKESKVFKTTTDKDFDKVIDMIKNLNNGKNIEKYIDVKEVLAYFAVNTFLVNLDSYSGGMYHNYYLYEKDGVFQILPWDLNMSFAGFNMNDSKKAINFPIDTPVTGNLEDAPLIGKLLEVDEYKKIYHDYLKKLVDEYFNNGKFEERINSLDNLISDYVKKDATAFYNYEAYKKSLSQLSVFGKDRTKSIQAQLEGTQPSTTYGSISTTLNLSELGGMSHDKKGKDGGENKENKEDNNPNNMGAMPSQENMKAAMDIIQNTNIEELTSQQKQRLKELGVDENMISTLKNGGADGGKPPMGNRNIAGKNNSGVFRLSKSNIVEIGVSLIVLLGGLIFVRKFKRRK
ncbi:CotH kinase family protein [Clostridium brassicae]|uniref:CotH kinase family protein n=1 Tax=Clostridium brassicae TaxID=2999072 RepID=UPI003898D6A8